MSGTHALERYRQACRLSRGSFSAPMIRQYTEKNEACKLGRPSADVKLLGRALHLSRRHNILAQITKVGVVD